MATFYRVHWYIPDAPITEIGHPLFVSNFGGRGRVDSDRYTVLYVATTAACAIAETFGNYNTWSPDLFKGPPFCPSGVRAISEYSGDISILNLNQGSTLYERDILPSRVVTRNRQTTQAWAETVWDGGEYDGVSWWSYYDPDWAAVGLWAWGNLDVVTTRVLTDDYHPMNEARHLLKRPWTNST